MSMEESENFLAELEVDRDDEDDDDDDEGEDADADEGADFRSIIVDIDPSTRLN